MAENNSLMSQRGYASSRGMALSTLQHHIKTGKLKTINGKIDPDYADVCLRELVDKVQSARGAGQRARSGNSQARATSAVAAGTEQPGNPFGEIADLESLQNLVPRNFAEAQFLNSMEDLRRRRIENGKAEGKLIDADEVNRIQFDMARQVRDNLMAIPSRVADELAVATTPTEVSRILTREIRQVLEGLASAADISPDANDGPVELEEFEEGPL